jgi:hypothetical protein
VNDHLTIYFWNILEGHGGDLDHWVWILTPSVISITIVHGNVRLKSLASVVAAFLEDLRLCTIRGCTCTAVTGIPTSFTGETKEQRKIHSESFGL